MHVHADIGYWKIMKGLATWMPKYIVPKSLLYPGGRRHNTTRYDYSLSALRGGTPIWGCQIPHNELMQMSLLSTSLDQAITQLSYGWYTSRVRRGQTWGTKGDKGAIIQLQARGKSRRLGWFSMKDLKWIWSVHMWNVSQTSVTRTITVTLFFQQSRWTNTPQSDIAILKFWR